MKESNSTLSQLRDFLAQLSTVKGELSNVTAPPFLLDARSVTEIPASWAEHHDLFLQPSMEPDAAKRALLILKSYLCSLNNQVYATSLQSGKTDASGAKKPLNAFLGELFLGTLISSDQKSETRVIVEQVSHHPPVTACFMYNQVHGISSSGYIAQETSFSPVRGVVVNQIGNTIIRDEVHEESHLMKLPSMAIKGLATGSPYPELQGTSYISSSSGYLATIQFEGKNSLGLGKINLFKAKIASLRDGGRVVYEMDGQWSGRMRIRDAIRGQDVETFDIKEVPTTEVLTKPQNEQSPWESRRAWRDVLHGIREGNMKAVREAKQQIEEGQRAIRAAEAEIGIDWPRIFFQRAETYEEFEVLARALPSGKGRSLETRRTDGVWRFIGIRAAEALLKSGQYHSLLKPTGQVIQDTAEGMPNGS